MDNAPSHHSLLNSQEQHAPYQAIIDCISDAAIAITSDSRVTLWNSAAEAMFGYSQTEALGQAITTLIIPPDYREAHVQGMKRLLSSENRALQRKTLELVAQHQDGTLFPIQISIFRADASEKPTFIAIIRDITRQKRLEDVLEHKNNEIESVVESMTEELTQALEREQLARKITGDILEETNLDALIQAALVGIGQLTQADRCVFWEYDPKSQSYLPVRHEYRQDEDIPSIIPLSMPDKPLFAGTLNQHYETIIPDVSQVESLSDVDKQLIEERGIKGLICVPIRYKEQFFGGLYIHMVRHSKDWDEETISLLENVAEQIALAIRNVQFRQDMEQALETLQQTESRFRHLINTNMVGILIANPEGVILETNNALLDLLGYSRGDLVSGQITWQTLSSQTCCPSDTVLQTAEAIVSAPCEMTLRRKDGQHIQCLVGTSCFSDSTAHCISYVIDIHKQKQAEEALEERESILQAMFEQSLDAVILQDDKGCIVEANPAACAFIGQPKEEIVGKSCPQLVEFEPGYNAQKGWQRFLEAGRAQGELSFYLPNGSRRMIEYNAVSHIRPNCHLAIFRDITTRRLALQELQSTLKRERLIRRIVGIISESFDIDFVLTTAAQEFCHFFKADRCFIVRYIKQPDGTRTNKLSGQYCQSADIPIIQEKDLPVELMQGMTCMQTVAGLTNGEKQPASHEVVVSQALSNFFRLSQIKTDTYLESLESIICECTACPEEPKHIMEEYLDKFKIRSALACEVFYRGIPYGAIVLHQCSHNRQWLQEELELLETLGPHISVAIYQAELYQEEQQAKEEAQSAKERYRMLYQWEKRTHETIQHLRQSFKPMDIFPVLLEQVGRTLQVDRCFVVQFQDKKPMPVQFQYLKDSTVQSLLGFIPPWETCPFFRECKANNPVFVKSVSSHPLVVGEWQELFQSLHIESFAAIPVHYDNDILNILILHGAHPREWEELEISFLNTVSNQLAIALYQAKIQEAIEQTSQMKTNFLANVSHELRTPLNAIIGYSEMMEKGFAGALSDKQQRYIHNVLISGRHLLDMVNDVLDLSKVDAGRIELYPEPLKLTPLLCELYGLVQPMLEAKQVELAFDIQDGLEEIKADPARLRQIFLNLLSNAIKFNTPSGTIGIRLFKTEDKRWWVCQVHDTGIGIPKDKLPELFTEFFQVDNSASRRQEGTGLGLALTKRLVELHGGTIYVDSQPNQGSTFTFRLPLDGA